MVIDEARHVDLADGLTEGEKQLDDAVGARVREGEKKRVLEGRGKVLVVRCRRVFATVVERRNELQLLAHQSRLRPAHRMHHAVERLGARVERRIEKLVGERHLAMLAVDKAHHLPSVLMPLLHRHVKDLTQQSLAQVAWAAGRLVVCAGPRAITDWRGRPICKRGVGGRRPVALRLSTIPSSRSAAFARLTAHRPARPPLAPLLAPTPPPPPPPLLLNEAILASFSAAELRLELRGTECEANGVCGREDELGE